MSRVAGPCTASNTYPRQMCPDILRFEGRFLSQVTDRVRIGAAETVSVWLDASSREGEVHSFIDIDPKKVGGVEEVDTSGFKRITKRTGDGPLIVVAVGIPVFDLKFDELEAKGIERRDFLFAA